MKAKIIETLAYPRRLVTGEQDLEACRHAGLYADRHTDCANCPQGPECHWLYRHGEYADLESQSLPELEDALAFTIGYVDSKILEWQHNAAHCKCDACSWLRTARRLYDRVLIVNETDYGHSGGVA